MSTLVLKRLTLFDVIKIKSQLTLFNTSIPIIPIILTQIVHDTLGVL